MRAPNPLQGWLHRLCNYFGSADTRVDAVNRLTRFRALAGQTPFERHGATLLNSWR